MAARGECDGEEEKKDRKLESFPSFSQPSEPSTSLDGRKALESSPPSAFSPLNPFSAFVERSLTFFPLNGSTYSQNSLTGSVT